MMKKSKMCFLVFAAYAGCVPAETVTNNLDVQGGFIYNHGAINPGDVGLTFTNAGIRDITVSAGQLSGVDPETGAMITNSANLLSLKAESLTTASNIVAGGSFVGDGSGLSNLNANSFIGSISASSLPTSGVWDAGGMIVTNMICQGDGSQLTGLTSTQVGLENVDNTSDIDKPISSVQAATNTALKALIAQKISSIGGVATNLMVHGYLGLHDELDGTNYTAGMQWDVASQRIRVVAVEGQNDLIPPTIMASGAGDSVANGVYLRSEDLFGKPSWVLEGASTIIYYLPLDPTCGCWVLVFINGGSEELLAYTTMFEEIPDGYSLPPKEEWYAWNGTDPAPTLSYIYEEYTLATTDDVSVVQTQLDSLITEVSNSPATAITTNQIATWNSGGELATSVQVSTETVNITTNLTVQGTISGDGSGLNHVAAGGSDGQLQFNENGVLAGNTNFFIHPVEKKLSFRSPTENIFRAYSSQTIADTNLIYSLRNENGMSVLRLRQNGQDTIRLSGDGSAVVSSLTLGGVTHTNWPSGGGTVTNITWSQIQDIPVDIADGDAVLSDADIAAMGYIKTDTDTHLTEAEVDAMVANNGFASANDLAEHTTSTNNPHLVTAAQVGAYTVGETDVAISNAVSGIQVNGYVATNHTGNVSIDGELALQTNLTVQGNAIFNGQLIAMHVPKQGDLSMGSYTNGLPQ
jgi:hypothetical protein